MLCRLPFFLSYQTGLLCLMFRVYGLLLCRKCILPLHFRTMAHLVGYAGLLDGFLALLVRDFLLLVGYCLHLLADAAHYGRPFILLLQFGYLCLQVGYVLTFLLPAPQSRCR